MGSIYVILESKCVNVTRSLIEGRFNNVFGIGRKEGIVTQLNVEGSLKW
jgi:hypothetical protein